MAISVSLLLFALHFILISLCSMTASELLAMTKALEIPDCILLPNGSKFTGIEALALTCARLRTAGDLHELAARNVVALGEYISKSTIFLRSFKSFQLVAQIRARRPQQPLGERG
jgi:hypothetical protein